MAANPSQRSPLGTGVYWICIYDVPIKYNNTIKIAAANRGRKDSDSANSKYPEKSIMERDKGKELVFMEPN